MLFLSRWVTDSGVSPGSDLEQDATNTQSWSVHVSRIGKAVWMVALLAANAPAQVSVVLSPLSLYGGNAAGIAVDAAGTVYVAENVTTV